MKNLAKIFVTVVAAMAAYACTIDTTETLGVKPEGQTTLTLSIEESRTQLGEKTGNLYPVTWCEDDVVAANGVKSTAIEIKGNGNAATFTFASEVTRPYSLVYPAPAEGVTAATEGLQVVTFLAEQAYTAGTFCDGAAPMYGYAEEVAEGETAPAIQLQHLTGVLRFELKGTHTLAGMTIATESGKIAGNFDLDCTTGALTAHEDAVNTVTVTFGGGLILTDEATPIYVAVPAGEYGLVTVTLTSTDAENNTMVVRFNSDYHPVKAATVKEFGTVTFAPGATTKPSGELIITNQADLLKLAKWSENKMLDEVTKVTVANDIDMSGVTNWHGIELFPAITFDGGNKTIKGLTAPLFGTVGGATIQNVKLSEVNITETERLHVGALACSVTNGTITNCSAAGSLTYNNTTVSSFTYELGGSTVDSEPDDLCVGGLLGMLNLCSISNCTSDINVTITEYVVSTSANSDVAVGGLIGAVFGSSTNIVSVTSCSHKGTIASNAKIGKIRPVIGGVIGYAKYANLNTLSNGTEENNGSITIEYALGNCTRTGGIVGSVRSANIDDATNYAPIEYKRLIQYPYIGGVIGQVFSSGTPTFKNITNYGDITAPTGEAAVDGTPYIGGVLGREAGTVSLSTCYNYGNLDLSFKSNGNAYVGGVVGGGATISCTDCDNHGSITLNGTSAQICLGGVAGSIGTKAPKFSNCDNYGAISVTLNSSAGGSIGGVGGLIKTGETDIIWSSNKNHASGDLTVAGNFNANLGVCGLASTFNWKNSDCSNDGDVNVTAKTTGGSIYLGGHSWTGNQDITNFTNKGNITFGGTIVTESKAIYMWGAGYTPSATLKNVHNEGTIKVTSDAVIAGEVRMGGLARSMGAATLDGCSNKGDIIFDGTCTTEIKCVLIGGIAGDHSAATIFQNGFTNSGDVIFSGTSAGEARVGGLAGHFNKALVIKSGTVKNDGNVYNYQVNENNEKVVGKSKYLFMGGLTGRAMVAQTAALENTGNVYARYAEGAYTAAAYIGGGYGCNSLTGNDSSANWAAATLVVSNAKVVCDVEAIGFTESAEAPIVGVGMITGSHRGTSALVNACTLGGRIAFTEENGEPVYKTLVALAGDKEVVDPETQETVIIPGNPNEISFFTKIYGGNWEAASATNCDGCSYVSAIE